MITSDHTQTRTRVFWHAGKTGIGSFFKEDCSGNGQKLSKENELAAAIRGATTRVPSRLRDTSNSEPSKATAEKDLPKTVEMFQQNGSAGRRTRRRAWVDLENKDLAVGDGSVGGEDGSSIERLVGRR